LVAPAFPQISLVRLFFTEGVVGEALTPTTDPVVVLEPMAAEMAAPSLSAAGLEPRTVAAVVVAVAAMVLAAARAVAVLSL
jgi:hypothetical protein